MPLTGKTNNLGIFFEFWDLNFFNRLDLAGIREIVDNILTGKTYVEVGPTLAIPYQQFWNLMNEDFAE